MYQKEGVYVMYIKKKFRTGHARYENKKQKKNLMQSLAKLVSN